MRLAQIVSCAVSVAVAPLSLVVACGGEVLVVGENPPDEPGFDAGGEDAFDDAYDPYGDGIATDSPAAPFVDSDDPFDAAMFDVTEFDVWAPFSDDHCSTSMDACSCSFTADGHVYSLQCSVSTEICDCDFDGRLLTSTSTVEACAPVDGGPPTLALLWLATCQFPL